ncbi:MULTISPECIES: flavoprotein [unclassified Micromonospora]|uniref:flavoprotein n=1 Tax=unclassified Micromonospora TaxID=2617518 RepID=UPI00363B04BE
MTGRAAQTSPAGDQPGPAPRVLVGASGAASVVMLPNYLATMRAKLGCHVTVLLTASAARFIPPRTAGLFADEVLDSTDPEVAFRSNHVKLASSHDLILVLPATANLLADVVHGHASTLLTATILAAHTPVLLVPAMNRVMWSKPAVTRNLAQCRADGLEVIEPEWGEGFEVSSKRMVQNPAMPSFTDIADIVGERLEKARIDQAPTSA